MELIHLIGNTYYIKNNTNIGIYKINDTEVYLIDTGNDKECGKKILKILNEQNWTVKGIINTHFHADHIGGNKVIQDRTGAKIYAANIESDFISTPILEPAFLYGASPLKDLKHKFLMADASYVMENIPDIFKVISLKGHSFNQIGIITPDDVCFLGDALCGIETINKYHIFFLYDVLDYLDTLDYLKTVNCKLYVPSHIEVTTNIENIIDVNKQKIEEIIKVILNICKSSKTFDETLQEIFNYYKLSLNLEQYVLVGSTIKAFLSYLNNMNKLMYNFKDNKMVWSCNED